jgi:hypothetical protein
MQVADGVIRFFRGKCATAGDDQDVLDSFIGDKLEHVIGEFIINIYRNAETARFDRRTLGCAKTELVRKLYWPDRNWIRR